MKSTLQGLAMKKDKNTIMRKYIFIDIIFIIIIILSHLNCLNQRTVPCFQDEYGYWVNAAVINGYDWSNIAKNMGYYAYGYSILLSIVIRSGLQPVLWMKVTTAINIFLLILIYMTLCQIGKKLLGMEQPILIKASTFLIIFYPQLTFSTTTSWSELLCTFIYCLTALIMISTIEKVNYMKYIVLSFVVAASYFVHHRFLGMIAVVILIIFIYEILVNKSIKAVMICIGLFFIFFCLFQGLDEYIAGMLREGENHIGVQAAQVSSHIGKIKMFFSVEGIKKIVLNLCGRIFSLNTSFIMLFIPSLYIVCRNIWQSLKNKEIKECLIYSFLVLSFFSTLLISILFMYEPTRIDVVLYERYVEPFVYIIIILGIYKIITVGISNELICITYGIHIILGIISYNFLSYANKTLFFMTSVPSLYKYFRIYFKEGIEEFIFGMMMVSVLVGTGALLFMNKRKITLKKNYIIAFVIIGILWLDQGYFAYSFRYADDKDIYKECDNIVNQIEDVSESIQVVTNNKQATCADSYVFVLQYLLPNQRFEICEADESIELPSGYVLVDNNNFVGKINNEIIVLESKNFTLLNNK